MAINSTSNKLTQISVALATFNGARYLVDQLNSLAEQIRLPYELVVTDDCSDDCTCEIVTTFASRAPFPVSLVLNEQRLGYGRNFLKAASLCTGSHVAFCDQDDVWLPKKLLLVQSVIENHGCELVAHSAKVVDRELRSLGVNFPDVVSNKLLTNEVKERGLFWPGFTLVVSENLISNAIAAEKMLVDVASSNFAHDELICDLAAKSYSCYVLAEPLALYRQHGGNLIGFHGAMKKLSNTNTQPTESK